MDARLEIRNEFGHRLAIQRCFECLNAVESEFHCSRFGSLETRGGKEWFTAIRERQLGREVLLLKPAVDGGEDRQPGIELFIVSEADAPNAGNVLFAGVVRTGLAQLR